MVPRDHVLTPEEIRALLQGPADGEPQGGVELLRELVQLVLTAVVQQPALGLPPTQRLQVTEMVPESFESWWGRAQQAPAWAALQLEGDLAGLVTVILHQPPPGMAADFLRALLRGLLREFAARMNRWLLGDSPLTVIPWSGAEGDSDPQASGGEGANQEVWNLVCHVDSQQGPWSLEIGLSQGLGQSVAAMLEQPAGAAAQAPASVPGASPGASPGLRQPFAGGPSGGEWEQRDGDEELEVRPARFQPLTPEPPETEAFEPPELLDLPLKVTVELGRTRLPIERIMELEPGVTIELDRLAGEMVDVLVNGKLIAKGEVVVVDDAFGVKITDILSPIERMRGLS